MNKTNKQLKERAEHVKKKVNSSDSAADAIRKLSKKLFLSERTIERDLQK